MTAVDDLIADLLGARYSLGDSNIIADVDIFVAALQQIQGGIIPPGVQPPNVVFAGPAIAPPAVPTFRGLVPADIAGLGPAITTLSGQANANKFINGDFLIDQRNANALFTPANLNFMCDRWLYSSTQPGKVQSQCINSLTSIAAGQQLSTYLALTSTGVYAVGGNDSFGFAQYVEGYFLADMLWGSVAAKPVTLSFWVYSSVAGPFSVVVRNVSATHSYLASYTVNQAATWEKKTIVIPGPNVGAWVLGNTAGLSVAFMLDGAGTSLSVPAGAWVAGVLNGAVGQTNWLASPGAAFAITALKLELGNVATPFVPDAYEQNLGKCQRYFQLYGDFGSPSFYPVLASGMVITGPSGLIPMPLITRMRTRPTVTFPEPAGNYAIFVGGGSTILATIGMQSSSQTAFSVTLTPSSPVGFAAGVPLIFTTAPGGPVSRIFCDAEL